MQREEILTNLVSILRNEFGVNLQWENADFVNLPLTGSQIGFDSFQMYQFLLCVEKRFHVFFSVDEICNADFRSLHDFQQRIISQQKKLHPKV